MHASFLSVPDCLQREKLTGPQPTNLSPCEQVLISFRPTSMYCRSSSKKRRIIDIALTCNASFLSGSIALTWDDLISHGWLARHCYAKSLSCYHRPSEKRDPAQRAAGRSKTESLRRYPDACGCMEYVCVSLQECNHRASS